MSDDELRAAAAELRERQPRARRWRRTVVSLALLLPAAARGQAPEALYELGAFQQAADSFAERAGREPAVAAHWYNLGSARYRSGADAQALVAWVIAARLAPRNGRIRRALNTLEAETRRDIDLLWIAPFTVREAWLLGGTLWLGGWVWLAFERRRRAPVLLLGLALAFIVAGLYTERRYGEPVAVAVTDTPLREAPYGSASPVESLEPGAALSVERRQGAWLLAARPDGGRGWLPAAGVVMLPRPR